MVTGVDSTRGMGYGVGTSLWINERGVNLDQYFAGVITIAVSDSGETYYRDSMCVDLFTQIGLGQTYLTTLLRPDEVANKNLKRNSWLVDNALLPAQSADPHSELAPGNWVSSAAQGAGLQLAIWDIVHDNGDGFSSGSVQASTDPNYRTDPDVLMWAENYRLWSIGKSSDLAFVYNNRTAEGVTVQMLIGPKFSDGPVPEIPEPSTALLAVFPLLAASFVHWRRRRCRAAGPSRLLR